LATNFHVVSKASRLAVLDPRNKTSHPARLVASDYENDLAILSLDKASKPMSLARAFNLKRGQEVMTLGYPNPELQGAQQKATFGRVNAPTGAKDDARLVQMDIPVQPGNSGGPLISDTGEVVGVVTARLRDYQSVNYAVKIEYLWPLLAAVGAYPNAPPQNGGSNSFTQIAEDFIDSVALVMAYD
jgi:S1-C subfamily serine protease